jgi:hypothetical protein
MRYLIATFLFFLLSLTPAGAMPIQQEVDQASTWLEQVLKTPIDDRVVVSSSAEPNAYAWVYGGNPNLYMLPSTIRSIEGRDFNPFFASPGPLVLIHELLHRDDRVACWNEFHEEGVVDALAMDLVPIYVKKFWGNLLYVPTPLYYKGVKLVRTRTARATHTSWKSRASRKMRQELWKAPCSVRANFLRARP